MTGSQVEVLAGPERRRRWSVAEKLEMVAETREPGVTVSLVARRQPNRQTHSRKILHRRAGDFLPVAPIPAEAELRNARFALLIALGCTSLAELGLAKHARNAFMASTMQAAALNALSPAGAA